MNCYQHEYKTDVISTDGKFTKVGTAKTTLRYFPKSKHFEIIRLHIDDKSLPIISNETVLREGESYRVCSQYFSLSSQSVLQFMLFATSMLKMEVTI